MKVLNGPATVTGVLAVMPLEIWEGTALNQESGNLPVVKVVQPSEERGDYAWSELMGPYLSKGKIWAFCKGW